jgi:hypothetical protein
MLLVRTAEETGRYQTAMRQWFAILDLENGREEEEEDEEEETKLGLSSKVDGQHAQERTHTA